MGFARFHLEGEADLWWTIMKKNQNEHGFGWAHFKELIKNCFYPISLQKEKEKEFLELEKGRMSVLQYAFKFMELSHFDPTMWQLRLSR